MLLKPSGVSRRPARRRRRAAGWGVGWPRPDWRRVGAGLREWGPYLALALLGLALRVAVVPSSEALAVRPLIGDEGNYVGIARALAAGAGVPDKWPWLRPPGYPLLLAAFFRATGGDLRAPLLFQAAVGAVVALLAAALASRLWGRRAALFAAAWAALDPSLVYYTRMLQTEVLYTLLVAVQAYALVRWATGADPTAGKRWLAVGGVAAGLAAVVRPAIFAVLPLLALWMLLRARRGGWGAAAGRALVFAGLCALVIAPCTLYNWRTYHRVILVDTTLGYTLWRDHRDGSLDALNAFLMTIPNPGDRQSYALRRGLRWIGAHPAATVRRGLDEVRRLWGQGPYVDDALDARPGLSDLRRNDLNLLTLLNWLIMLPLAGVGAWRLRRSAALPPLALIAVVGPSAGVALSHAESRFLLPSLPLLIPLAAGVVAAPGLAVASRRRLAGLAVSVLLCVALCWSASAGDLARRGEIAARDGVARVAERLGRDDLALAQYQAILRRNPDLSEPYAREGLLAQRRGDDDAALADFDQALARDENNYRARALAAAILRERGRADDLRRLFAAGYPSAPDGLAWAWDHAGGPAPSQLTLDGTDSGFVRGFYGPERGLGGRSFRWMSGDAALRLAAPAGSSPRTLLLTVASPRPAGAPPLELTVLVNGRPVGRVAVHQELGWNDLRLTLPADLAASPAYTVELRAPVTRVPGDARPLAVAVAGAALEGR